MQGATTVMILLTNVAYVLVVLRVRRLVHSQHAKEATAAPQSSLHMKQNGAKVNGGTNMQNGDSTPDTQNNLDGIDRDSDRGKQAAALVAESVEVVESDPAAFYSSTGATVTAHAPPQIPNVRVEVRGATTTRK